MLVSWFSHQVSSLGCWVSPLSAQALPGMKLRVVASQLLGTTCGCSETQWERERMLLGAVGSQVGTCVVGTLSALVSHTGGRLSGGSTLAMAVFILRSTSTFPSGARPL